MNQSISTVVYISLVTGFLFIFTRIFLRYFNGLTASFKLNALLKDFSNGYFLPQCVELLWEFLLSDSKPNPTIIIMCVIYTILLIINDLLDNGRDPRSRSRKDDTKKI